MLHTMGLYAAPFESIAAGRKSVEIRLDDEKRRRVCVGDTIEFILEPQESRRVRVTVTGLRRFATFRELYESVPASDMDVCGESVEQMVAETYGIYTPEQERKYGALAITVSLQPGSLSAATLEA
ncbi:ASCH domain-containing protein [Bifidobacterium bombi]|uniref:ASCH domain protein n=1 Tax=Bifidobacterium bombi DSM 19703 TaxID=1341695 RepID=A0A080N369_9BIFI|nr:ASCH domain-containing protein [Bifidobacterium bombi]KFF31376.1 ASCH domain protein [Bifidobacterium bombi DSM 19703]